MHYNISDLVMLRPWCSIRLCADAARRSASRSRDDDADEDECGANIMDDDDDKPEEAWIFGWVGLVGAITRC